MEWMSLNTLREKYLSFFESKGHLRLGSFSLVPQGDKSLLLINSGMAPMKKYFTGEVTPPSKRVTTCQKCIRTPDLERVGHTARHGTYFEMLGNFSFGDYFKEEAITWAWEFLTETLEIPSDLLWPSIYESDDEAYAIWKDKIGVNPEHIVRLGKADNFWEHGTGPCGPCSEIYFDRGEKYGCGSPDCKPGCDCDRFMEIWNNVFSQFNSDGKGNYPELKNKNIDTGMGLERLACVMQGVNNLFEVDTVRRILLKVCEKAKCTYGDNDKKDVSIRVITDHIRSTTFLICDGVMPSNEGRGYVLRRLLRRAARHGRLLDIKGLFLYELCDTVVEENISAYPELGEKRDYIKKIIKMEEERFEATLDGGLSILNSMIEKTLSENKNILSGEDVFKLNDTYGFPVDLTAELAEEKGLDIDRAGFEALMDEQKKRARAARGDNNGWKKGEKNLFEGIAATDFVGYEHNSCEANILFIIAEGEQAEAVSEGEFTLVLDRTPFYAESGGQVGDMGVITKDGASAFVLDTKKTAEGIFMHFCRLESGIFKIGDKVFAGINEQRRAAIKRNHSAAHLLQAALRQVLGSHVEQAGSYVDDERVRFDFKHFAPMSAEEISKTEAIVNESILSGAEVTTVLTDPESARKAGATALFGEKYGSVVRMVKMGDISVELCGGTHLDNTAKAGLFKIISESSVAAGVRRIEGVTGKGVLELYYRENAVVAKTAEILKTNEHSVAEKAEALQNEIKELKKQIESLKAKEAAGEIDALMSGIVSTDKYKLLFTKVKDAESIRNIGDILRDKESDIVAVLYALKDNGSVVLNAVCGKSAVEKGAHAGNIIKAVAKILGGGGGGRPDSASSGGKDASKLPEAKEEFFNITK